MLAMRRSAGVALLLLFGAASARAPAPPVVPIDYMGALRDAEAKLAGVVEPPPGTSSGVRVAGARSTALQQLAIARSQVGDEQGALDAFDQALGIDRTDPAQRAAGEEGARQVLADHVPEEAVAAIARAARGRQVVILNEAHHVARHRAFGLEVARELRKAGFEYLAMESLAPDTAALMKRGYAVAGSGTYTREPFFGDFVRQAIASGYTLVAYEQGSPAPPPDPSNMFATIEAREEAQAQNLVDRVLKEHPQARLLVYVGYQHAMKGEIDVGGRKLAWMAERLRRKTGIDPLCIDQANAGQQSPHLVSALERSADDPMASKAIVLRERSTDEYWPGSDNFDMQVIHSSGGILLGRPQWIGWSGERHRRVVPDKLLPRQGRRLIQAFIAGEPADAVPIDQVLAVAGQPPPMLMLPDRKVRFEFED